MKSAAKSLSFLLALAIGSGVLAASAQAQQTRQITVTGQGTIATVPDMAMITLGVIHQDKDAAQAMQRSSAAVSAVLSQLIAMGVEKRDVQTGQVSLSPIYTHRGNNVPPVIEGFRASLSLNVRVRDLDALGSILGAVLADGANQFSGLQFGLETPGPLQDQARQAAVADALRKAQLYADAADVTLGDVLSISENGGREYPQMRMAADMAEAIPIAEGELSVSQSVTLVIGLN